MSVSFPGHDEAQQKALDETKRLVSTIRKAKVVWMNAKGEEIAETPFDCMPGETYTITAPHQSDVALA